MFIPGAAFAATRKIRGLKLIGSVQLPLPEMTNRRLLKAMMQDHERWAILAEDVRRKSA